VYTGPRRELERVTAKWRSAVAQREANFELVRKHERRMESMMTSNARYTLRNGDQDKCRSALREREGTRDREERVTRQRLPAPERALRPPGEGGAGDCRTGKTCRTVHSVA